MNPRNTRSLPLASGLALLLALTISSGCTTVKQEFHGYDPGQVWTAMQVVANNPEYRDWHVVENHVHVDGNEARIHIYRILERSYVRHGTRPWDEQVDWRFRVMLENVDPPTARFVTRGVVIPTQATYEGRRYFADVRRMLHAEGALPEPPRAPAPPVEPPAAQTPPEPPTPPAPPQREPVDDLGDLLDP